MWIGQTHRDKDTQHPEELLLPRNLYYKNILQAKKFKLQLYTKWGLFPSPQSENKLPKPCSFRTVVWTVSFSWGSVHGVTKSRTQLSDWTELNSTQGRIRLFFFEKLSLWKSFFWLVHAAFEACRAGPPSASLTLPRLPHEGAAVSSHFLFLQSSCPISFFLHFSPPSRGWAER